MPTAKELEAALAAHPAALASPEVQTLLTSMARSAWRRQLAVVVGSLVVTAVLAALHAAKARPSSVYWQSRLGMYALSCALKALAVVLVLRHAEARTRRAVVVGVATVGMANAVVSLLQAAREPAASVEVDLTVNRLAVRGVFVGLAAVELALAVSRMRNELLESARTAVEATGAGM